MYQSEMYTEAALLFQQALSDVQSDGSGSLHAGLLNNLGAALFRQGEFEQAASAFSGSARMAGDLSDAVRAGYNAGNAAAMQQELETALDNYQMALLADPDNENAKYNYEFVKRQLEDQQEQESDEENQDQEQDRAQHQENDQENEEQNQDPEQQQDQDDQQNPDENQPEREQQQNPEELSEEEAQRILQALENEEEQLLRQIQKMKTRPRRVEKDW